MIYLYILILIIALWIIALCVLFWIKKSIDKNTYRYARLFISLAFMSGITVIVGVAPIYTDISLRSYAYIYGISLCISVDIYIIQRIYKLWRELHPLILD